MNKIAYCAACLYEKKGVKTRIPLTHTCGQNPPKKSNPKQNEN